MKDRRVTARLAVPRFGRGQAIGLFGGSFNPAHRGHAAVALYALKRLNLDWVWWLVAPQNPLKDPREYAAYAERLEQVAGIAKHPRFIVSDLENRWGTETTAELLDRLSVARQQARFVWIMGADSFATLHEWHHGTDIAESIPLAFLARPGYSIRALDSRAALRYATRRVAIEDARTLPFRQPPAWTFIPMPLRTESSTEIRRSRRGLTKSPEPERAASS